MSSFAWVVLGVIAVFFYGSLGDGVGQSGVMDVVLVFALLLVIYGAVSRDNSPE